MKKIFIFVIALMIAGAGFWFAGYQLSIGVGDSMQPTQSNPSLMVVHTDYNDLKEGDIVIHNSIAHRVVDVSGDQIITQGDNNRFADPPVDKSEVRGEVIHTFNHPFHNPDTEPCGNVVTGPESFVFCVDGEWRVTR